MQTEEIVIDMPSLYHSIIQSNLAAAFRASYRNEYRALTQPSLLLGDWDSEPDLAVFPKRPITNWQNDEVKIKEIPLIAIEIISPRQIAQDIWDKCQKYLQAGVRSCWIVNPIFETIHIYDANGKKDIFSEKNPKIYDPSLNITIDFEEVFS
jgi:Uma2 family endonuclease